MATVWILSHGEQSEGKHIAGVYESWFNAIEALVQIGTDDYDGEPVRKVIDEDSDIAIVRDGPFYSIVRPHEVL